MASSQKPYICYVEQETWKIIFNIEDANYWEYGEELNEIIYQPVYNFEMYYTQN